MTENQVQKRRAPILFLLCIVAAAFLTGTVWFASALMSTPIATTTSQRAVAGVGTAVTQTTYLPLIARAELLPPLPEAIFRIETSGGLNASTFNPGSFVLINPSTHDQRITRLRLDLGTALFPDLVFDPNGTAGDTTAKNLQPDSNTGVFLGHALTDPHDGGFDAVEIAFAGFDPGESFSFSIDVDPTSIKGSSSPGPFAAGSVSGLELAGATVTVTFADGTVITGQTFRLPGSDSGSEGLVRAGLPAAPTIEIVGVPTVPAVVTEATQIVRVTGAPARPVTILLVEGGLFTAGVPGGGFDLDPFEANSALQVKSYSAVTSGSGTVEIPITLTRSLAEGGLNYMTAVQENGFGMKGAVSTPIVLHLQNE